jgi:hypothetical protein
MVIASTFVDAPRHEDFERPRVDPSSLEALESPSKSHTVFPSSHSDPSSCLSPSIAVEARVVSSSALRRRYKIENRSPSLKGCMERPDEYEHAVKYLGLLEVR